MRALENQEETGSLSRRAYKKALQHKQAESTLRLASKTSLHLDSRELSYQVRLASKRLRQDRLTTRLEKTSLAEDKESLESEIEDE